MMMDDHNGDDDDDYYYWLYSNKNMNKIELDKVPLMHTPLLTIFRPGMSLTFDLKTQFYIYPQIALKV